MRNCESRRRIVLLSLMTRSLALGLTAVAVLPAALAGASNPRTQKVPAQFVFEANNSDSSCTWGIGVQFQAVAGATSYVVNYFDGYYKRLISTTVAPEQLTHDPAGKGVLYLGVTGGGYSPPCSSDSGDPTEGGRFSKGAKVIAGFPPDSILVSGHVTRCSSAASGCPGAQPQAGVGITAHRKGGGGATAFSGLDGTYRMALTKKGAYRFTPGNASGAITTYTLGARTLEIRGDKTGVNFSGYGHATVPPDTTQPPLPPRFDPGLFLPFGPKLALQAREITRAYYQKIPSSPVRSAYEDRSSWTRSLGSVAPLGALNNIASGANEYACGGYQAKVLDFLDGMRSSSDPDVRARFEGLDYGPIETLYAPGTSFGGHQAVVLYPHGTDPTTTGVVFDPWIDQQPNIYGIGDWADKFGGQTPRPTRVYQGQYPLTGGSGYPGGNRRRATARSPAGLAQPNVPRSPAPTRRLSVVGPVRVLLNDGSGGVIGFSGSGRLRDTSHLWIDFEALRKAKGYATVAMFPRGQQSVRMRGTGKGRVHVVVAWGKRSVRVYKAIRVHRGGELLLRWPRGAGRPTLHAGRRVISSHRKTVPAAMP
jgi:hypothetical protein